MPAFPSRNQNKLFSLFHGNSSQQQDASQSSSITVEPKKAPLSLPALSPKRISSSGRSVSFCPDVVIHFTIHLSEYTDEEKRRSWLSPREMEIMKAERRECIKVMDKCNCRLGGDDDENDCFRGLEAKTVEGYKRKRFNVVDACMAVMDEQSDQIDRGVYDEEAIAAAYVSSNSSRCAEEARRKGILDAMTVCADFEATKSKIAMENQC